MAQSRLAGKAIFFKISFMFMIVTTSLLVQYFARNYPPPRGFRRTFSSNVTIGAIEVENCTRGMVESPNSSVGLKPGKGAERQLLTREQLAERRVNTKMVSVGYFEGLRSYWVYEKLFQPFRGEINCSCMDSRGLVKKRMFTKISEIGVFDIIVFPYDVAVAPGIDDTWKSIHKQRRHSQRWVYATRETPYKLTKSFIPDNFKRNTYHWWCTYRSEADISIPYGYFERYRTPKMEHNRNWAVNKTRLLSWMSSNAAKQWNRTGFIDDISALVDVDIYGRASGVKCPRNSTECDEKISSHKFYLALENSCCREYISEKFWRSLTLGTVPVVVGPPKTDYLRIAPPHSFIYADDFKSLEALIAHLKLVGANSTLYNEFFKWREFGEVVNMSPESAKDEVTGRTPPPESFYSCATACKMADLYRREMIEKRERKRLFNPRSYRWGGSCGSCGKHEWISKFYIG